VENMELVLRIANDNLEGEAFLHFALRSTTECSATLGSHIGVELWDHSEIVVMSTIAL
jgi:hypothetical protein